MRVGDRLHLQRICGDHSREHAKRVAEPTSFIALKSTQKVQNVLLVRGRQRVEIANDIMGFRLRIVVRSDRGEQIARASIVQEENPLTDAPQWCGTKLAAARLPLRNTISQVVAHIVELKVAVRSERHAAQTGGDA